MIHDYGCADADSSSAVATKSKQIEMKLSTKRLPILSDMRDMRDDISLLVTYTSIQDYSLNKLIKHIKYLLNSVLAIITLLVAILITLIFK